MVKLKSQVIFGLLHIVSAEVSFKNYIVAPHALQSTKSGPQSKKVGNHCTRALGESSPINDVDGVTWSYFRRLQTSLAAEFRTDCSLSSRHFGAPARGPSIKDVRRDG